jgi:hypothetical protein
MMNKTAKTVKVKSIDLSKGADVVSTAFALTAENVVIVDALLKSNGVVLDEHTDDFRAYKTNGMFGVVQRGNEQCVCNTYHSAYCTNKITMRQGQPVLNRWSIAGNVNAMPGASIADRLREYNVEADANEYSSDWRYVALVDITSGAAVVQPL